MFRGSIKLGTILGITIRLDYSWFIIFFLITWSLSAHRLPLLYPDWPQLTYWTIGIITSILFFTSVLIHEMAHSLVARGQGVPVYNITLFIFGGAAQITQEPKEAKDEFVMAFAGPAASLVLSAIFWILYLLLSNISEPISTILSWLGSINLVLAIFNLIPGFPLDGGRVLRAIIWGVTKDFTKSTQIAAAIGRGIAFLFIFIGIWMIFGGNWVNGLWIAFIGWFLENAATASSRQVALKDILQGHTVREVMATDCPNVSGSLTIDKLVNDYILYTTRRCFPIVDNEQVKGIITLHNVKDIPRHLWTVKTVEEAMTPFDRMKKVSPKDGLYDVLEMMASEDINQLPVVEDSKLLGIVGRDNILAFIHTRAELGV